MMERRWTDEIEAAATRALWKHGHLGSPLDAAAERDEPAAVAFTRGAVRAVLDSLARTGALLPAGKTRQQRGHGVSTSGLVRSVTEYPDGSKLLGPWQRAGGDR